MKAISPNRLFLIDGLGALCSAVALGLILPLIHPPAGIPLFALRDLALGALILSVYSLSCSRWLQRQYRYYLLSIAVANLAYCVATGFMLHLYRSQLASWAWIYFVGEILIIVGLAIWEIQVGLRLSK